MASVLKAEIQARPAGERSSRSRAVVSMPRSPTKRDGVDAEASLDLLDLRRHRLGIPRVAGEDLHGQRAAVLGAQQAEDDLQLAFLAVPVMAERGQRDS